MRLPLRLLQGAATALSPAGPRARLLIMTFHRVLPAPDPMLRFEIDRARFGAQLDLLGQYFNILRLDEACERMRAGELPARALCLTFDDGYASNVTEALPELQSRGLPGTFFIATAFLNGGRMFNDTVIETVRRL
ncbi:MAG: polysaccharide deacetylase family protein, partial [Gammaproteobacteria bacterium]|nr:polysaccharide deacetylase family protein [Gammaproteobacteria bacterium]